MSLSRRELLLASATSAVVVGLVSWVVAAPMLKDVQKAHAERAKLQNEKIVLERLIAQRGPLEEQLESLRAQLPRFKPGEQVSAQIILAVKKIADDQSLSLSLLEPDAEKPTGDISEIAIKCAWEGTLESITHFLHAVQGQGVMLDIRQINIQPAQNTTQAGRLRGNFKMFYAFMREKPGTTKAASAAATNAPVSAANEPAPVLQITSNAAPAETQVAMPVPSNQPQPAPSNVPVAADTNMPVAAPPPAPQTNAPFARPTIRPSGARPMLSAPATRRLPTLPPIPQASGQQEGK